LHRAKKAILSQTKASLEGGNEIDFFHLQQ
jgi:hypothetical protein